MSLYNDNNKAFVFIENNIFELNNSAFNDI